MKNQLNYNKENESILKRRDIINDDNNIVNANETKNKIEENKVHGSVSTLLQKWELVKNNIPSLPLNLAIMIFLSNLIFPSSGTFYLSCIGDKFSRSQIVVGILQLLTLAFLIGWAWSIYWGILTLKKSY